MNEQNLGKTEALKQNIAQQQKTFRNGEELENFIHIASHDLQEPLRMVSSYVRLLQKKYAGKLDSEADEYIEFAVDGVKRMKIMLDDLLIYSRINKNNFRLKEIDSNELFNRVYSRLRMRFQNFKMSVNGSLPVINADTESMTELVQHLLVNAAKFNKNAIPQVEINACQGDNEWMFRIRDNGIGIEPGCTEKIFNLFQKLHNHSEYTGSGMGLAICKKIIEHHNGKIWVESIPEIGSTFIFTLPMINRQ